MVLHQNFLYCNCHNFSPFSASPLDVGMGHLYLVCTNADVDSNGQAEWQACLWGKRVDQRRDLIGQITNCMCVHTLGTP